ncbi:hypothetical protein Q5762_32800 [Streptomyces sp. P9(2023)]|uniref:hypothetical protein n=1 Tax=unclassified Streptomyces TaxID=2593676 RepID=UPI0028F3F0ED|nr:hypothetical protein [Streptomyces sp. P9(2023)]MDT9693020.1 hypothetical protein [Streptomyces sp. P9(2023)]
MDAFRKFFEGNAVFFGVVVPILAIAGSFFGSWAAGWMQARGGRDQAAAAREAAKIAAEAQRVAALWTVRQVFTSEFIHQTRRALAVTRKLYEEDDESGALSRELNEVALTFMQQRIGLELTATAPVVEAVDELSAAISECSRVAHEQGPGAYAEIFLRGLCIDGDTSAQAAYRELSAYRTIVAADGTTIEDQVSAGNDARTALRAVHPALSEARIKALMSHFFQAPDRASADYAEARLLVTEKTKALIRVSRAMLRSEDDVAPTEPEQRRRWWRRRRSSCR